MKRVDAGRAVAVRENLRRIFANEPDERIEEFVREFLMQGIRNHSEVRRYEAMSATKLRAYCRTQVLRGGEHIEAALEREAPVVVFTPHFGNYPLGALWLALAVEHRKPLLYFYDPPERNPFAPVLRRLLDKLGCAGEAIHNDKSAVLKALKGLRRGAVLTMMPDVYQYDRASLYVPMFGHFTLAMPGTAFFAIKSGATLLPFYCHTENGQTVLCFDRPIAVDASGSDADDYYRLTAAIVASMEAHVRAQPGLWAYWDVVFNRFAPGVRPPAGGEAWEERYCDLRLAMTAAGSATSAFLARFDERRSTSSLLSPVAPALLSSQ